MLFSDLINPDNITIQKSFLLWMIYEWPIFLDNYNKILAYSSYKIWWWSRSQNFMISVNRMPWYYIKAHVNKLESFLWKDYNIVLNTDIKELYTVSNNKSISSGVSVVIDFDLNLPNDINIENYISWKIEKWLIDIDDQYKNRFFIWAMESRWSLDFSLNFFSMDLAQRDFPEIAKRKMYKYNDIIWAVFNYNPRLTQENSNQKNDQFRVNLKYYMWTFWLFTPYKIDYYKFENHIPLSKDDNRLFIDKKYEWIELTSVLTDRNTKINELAIKLKQQWLSEEAKKDIIEKYRFENLIDDDDDEILHSSQNVKEMAKIKEWYICEMNNKHITFSSKSNGKNYVEAHHLIPFSERDNYELSIDVIENIVCLCPNCHREIHLAIDEQKKSLLLPLFNKKVKQLKNIWINIDLETLYKYYKVQS